MCIMHSLKGLKAIEGSELSASFLLQLDACLAAVEAAIRMLNLLPQHVLHLSLSQMGHIRSLSWL